MIKNNKKQDYDFIQSIFFFEIPFVLIQRTWQQQQN